MTRKDLMTHNGMILAIAKDYLKLGFKCLWLYGPGDGTPCSCSKKDCRTPCKHPQLQGGYKSGFKDTELMMQRFRELRADSINIGIVTGTESGILVFDQDRHKTEADGVHAFQDILRELGIEEDTTLIETPSGGRHTIYRIGDAPAELCGHPNMEIKPGLELKGDKGYIVAYPSVGGNGMPYKVIRSFKDLKPIPIELIKYLSQKSKAPDKVQQKVQTKTWLEVAFEAAGLVTSRHEDGRVFVKCPFGSRHSTKSDSTDTSTAILPVGRLGTFKCLHASCSNVKQSDVIKAMPTAAIAVADIQQPRKSKDDKFPRTTQALLDTFAEPQWVDVWAFDELHSDVYMKNHPYSGRSGQCSDTDITHTIAWFEREKGVTFGPNTVLAAIKATANKHRMNPIRDYLESVVPKADDWLLSSWLTRFCGVSDTDYSRVVGRKWLVSAVARVYEPGCQVDSLLILEGAQGIGKSSALRVLGGTWYASLIGDVTKQVQSIAQNWIVELTETDSLDETRLTALNGFITQTEDVYRPPYGMLPLRYPRRCVFASTTNDEHYLRDPNGARRFWPIRCGSKIDIDGLIECRDALWGGAVKAYEAGESWHLTQDENRLRIVETEERQLEDPWTDHVVQMVRAGNDSMYAILQHLGIPQHTTSSVRRVSSILRRAGYRATSNGSQRTWTK